MTEQQVAEEAGGDASSVAEEAFRYPGPKPSTREAGVIMLADKVEAATRTLAHPNASNIRAMIHRIVNSVIADGQFSECPLTFEEIHVLADTFVSVLVGIYHQRIEYPDTREISSGDQARAIAKAAVASGSATPKEAVITLEIPPAEASEVRELKPVEDTVEEEPALASEEVLESEEVPSGRTPAIMEPVTPAPEDPTPMVDYESAELLPDISMDDGWPGKR